MHFMPVIQGTQVTPVVPEMPVTKVTLVKISIGLAPKKKKTSR
jgi:hypothetical protein